MIERKQKRVARIGVFAVGHAVYWGQFEGLLDRLMAHHATLLEKIGANGVEIVDFGMVDSSQAAFAALETIRAASVDLLMCNMATYATSSTFAPIVRDSNVPMILVALQPRAASV